MNDTYTMFFFKKNKIYILIQPELGHTESRFLVFVYMVLDQDFWARNVGLIVFK